MERVQVRTLLLLLLLLICCGANDVAQALSQTEDIFGGGGCVARRYGYDSVVCVCTAERCDDAPAVAVEQLRRGQVLRVVSARDGQRLRASIGRLTDGASARKASGARLRVGGAAAARQSMFGFGGALTDAAAINILSLSAGTQRRLLEQYFGAGGARYSVVRVPIAGTDLSVRNYTYDDGCGADPSLGAFALAPEDMDYKIPVLTAISKLAGDDLRLFGSSWAAPAWMVKWDENGLNHLRHKYYQTWAEYYVKFLDAYSREGLTFWGLTTQNEPSNGYIVNYNINRLGWSPEAIGVWIRDNLCPTLKASGWGGLRIMIHDDQRSFLPDWPSRTLNDSCTSACVSGIAVHWYTDKVTDPNLLTQTHDLFPDKFLLYTEACDGNFMSGGESVQLGNWTRAENYAWSIIQASNNWVSGWVDWNVALDLKGGPTWVSNYLDASIIVNATADEFLKQPTYYALTHFSRYVPRGSHNVPITVTSEGSIFATAFITSQEQYVVVLLNRDSTQHEVCLTFDEINNAVYEDSLPGHSIVTLVIK